MIERMLGVHGQLPASFSDPKMEKQDNEHLIKPPRLEKACWLWHHRVPELTDDLHHPPTTSITGASPLRLHWGATPG
jgi:hypothetical protein